jgi:D-lyxose ketol-isomerase
MKFQIAKNVSPNGINQQMKGVYAEKCVNIRNVQCWAAHVHYGKPEQVSLN